jgi:hypothetical protein
METALRVYRMKTFRRFQRKEGIDDDALRDAIRRAGRGLIDADLGGGLIKQRVARKGQGRSGGYRVVIACRLGARAVFLYGFAKNEIDNIEDDVLEALREIGGDLLRADEEEIEKMIADDRLTELIYDEEDEED